ISTAAPCDLEFAKSATKLKKETLTELAFTQAPDILAQVLEHKRDDQFVVGFAAEAEINENALIERFKEKLEKKPVDLLVGNAVSQGDDQTPTKGFDQWENHYYYL